MSYYVSRLETKKLNIWHECALRCLLDKLKRTTSVAEFGCGSGVFLKKIRDDFDVKAFGYDISPLNIENLRMMGLAGEVLDFTQVNDSFPTNCFDIAISLETIEHVADTRVFLDLIFRSLKPNGIVLITTPNAFNLRRRLDFLLGRHSDPLMDPSRVEFAAHIRAFSFEMVEKCLVQAGFESCRLTGDRVPLAGERSKLARLILSLTSSHVVISAKKPG